MARRAKKHPHLVATKLPSGGEERTPDTPFAEGVHDELDADLRHRMISEAAYFLYTQRGYEDGYDVEDWLQAEAEIDHVLLNPEQNQIPNPAGARE
jgi:hypothetical protein